MLVDGKWMENWQPVQAKDKDGRFVRQQSSFRNWITEDGTAGPTGDAGFKAEAGRYHLYVALICPWASGTLMARKLKKLDDVISVDVVEPVLTEQGWKFGDFPGAGRDSLNGVTFMHDVRRQINMDKLQPEVMEALAHFGFSFKRLACDDASVAF